MLYQEYIELKKANALLKQENEQLKSKLDKQTVLKSKYRQLKDAYLKSEQLRKDQAVEFTGKIKTLKKKTKFFKDRLKQSLQENVPPSTQTIYSNVNQSVRKQSKERGIKK